MFLRKLRVHKDGKEHGYWSLVETIRTADGPRQRTLCYLGELNGSAHARWQKTVEVFNEQGETTQLKLFPSEAEASDDPNVARVLVKKVRVERTRRFGDCYLALELWKQLGAKQRFGELFQAEFDVLLCDLTSMYVEGAAEANPMMRRGYSRDHHPALKFLPSKRFCAPWSVNMEKCKGLDLRSWRGE